MNAGRLLELTRNFSNCNLQNGYFLRFHHSNYSSRALGKFLLVENNEKTINLHIQKQQFFSSSQFLIVGKTPNDFVVQKHPANTDFSTKNLNYHKYATPKARSNLTKSQADSIETLHIEKLEYMQQYKGQNETNIMQIEMNQFNSTKWISLIYRLFFICNKFAQIFIPDDAYKFVKGMDELMSKVVEQKKPPNSPIFVGVRGGLNYDYGLKILPFNGRLEFRMESISTSADPWHKPNDLYMPVQLLPLLRDKIAKMLIEFDGTEQIGPPPSPLPKWILEEDLHQQNVVTSEEDNKEQWEISREETLDFNVNIMNEKHNSQIKIELQRNKRGDEFIQIVQKFDKLDSLQNVGEDNNKSFYFPPIPMPTDAYRLLDAMHTLSNDLQEKCPNLQIPDDLPLGTPICRQIVKNGLLYDYKLKIYISPASKQLDFRLQTITTGAYKFHTSSKLYGPIPIHVFNWLKEKMAELLKSSSNQQEQLKLNNVNEKGQIAYKEEANKIQEGLIRRETEFYWLETEPKPRLMKIELKQGKSGRKYIRIVQQRYEKNIGEGGGDVIFIDFPNILVPEDAYRFFDAMQTMSNKLQEKQAKPALLTGDNKSSMVCQKLVKGLNYDYKLEIHLCQNQQFDFRLQTMPNNAYKRHKPKELHGPIPIHMMFTWLMENMAEILDDYDQFDRN